MTDLFTKEYGKKILGIAGQLAVQSLTVLAIVVLQDVGGRIKTKKKGRTFRVKNVPDFAGFDDILGESHFPKDKKTPKD